MILYQCQYHRGRFTIRQVSTIEEPIAVYRTEVFEERRFLSERLKLLASRAVFARTPITVHGILQDQCVRYNRRHRVLCHDAEDGGR